MPLSLQPKRTGQNKGVLKKGNMQGEVCWLYVLASAKGDCSPQTLTCKNSEVFLLPLVQPELHAEGRLMGRNRDCRHRLRTWWTYQHPEQEP